MLIDIIYGYIILINMESYGISIFGFDTETELTSFYQIMTLYQRIPSVKKAFLEKYNLLYRSKYRLPVSTRQDTDDHIICKQKYEEYCKSSLLCNVSPDELSKMNLFLLAEEKNKKNIFVVEDNSRYLKSYTYQNLGFYIWNATYNTIISFCQAIINSIPIDEITKNILLPNIIINRAYPDDKKTYLKKFYTNHSYYKCQIIGRYRLTEEQCSELFKFIKENLQKINSINFATYQEAHIGINHETKELEELDDLNSDIAMVCAWIKHCMI